MLTCYGSLSRNRTVGVRLGQGERLADILASSSQVAEGVATAGARPGGGASGDMGWLKPARVAPLAGRPPLPSTSRPPGPRPPLPAAVVVTLARRYRVQLPVLTAVAQVVDGHITAKQAVFEIMNLPQIEER